MLRSWTITLVLLACSAFAHAGDFTFTLEHGGLARQWRVHVPQSYDASRAAPLLVALHGGGGNMDLQADESLYHQVSTSEREGAILVFPNGYSRMPGGKLATWNAGRCCAAARDRNVDDVGFIRAVVADARRRWNIDGRRIFATGMSNGAMMAYRLACDAADLFTAIAPVAGTDNTTGCRPSRPVAVLHIHARDDSHVLFEGGAGPDSARASAVTDYVSVPKTVEKWAALDGCSAQVLRVVERPGASCDAHPACSGGTKVQLCVTETGGHSWPGGAKARQGRLPAPSQAISANDIMWDFFRQVAP
ncbi:extracellular catalytic domain type 1 short-chain-length polyhydroxyalkanoate depolymerase [Ramlibacter sp. PS4R-6]|uniref:extracellular catalytic domain type 1 short-chain-length polyhydroxyalkanoate depolymerase n=1 Tax=Ramlibacter sp. PS4R-6 TaxID=3133438 RepID=UPI00309E220D